MKYEIELVEYDNRQGLQLKWEYGFNINVKIEANAISIEANRAGLLSLANHLLNLAQEGVPTGMHVHLDEYNSLEEGSCDLVLIKS